MCDEAFYASRVIIAVITYAPAREKKKKLCFSQDFE